MGGCLVVHGSKTIRVAPPSRQGGGVAQRQEASSYANIFSGTDPVTQFANRTSFGQFNRHGAASCRFATRPVLRTRSGHPCQPRKRMHLHLKVGRAVPCHLFEDGASWVLSRSRAASEH